MSNLEQPATTTDANDDIKSDANDDVKSDTNFASWDRAEYSRRSRFISVLLDTRWRILQCFPFSMFTYYNRYLNAVTPFEIIGAISVYVLVVIMGSKIGHGSPDTSQYAIFISVVISCRYNLLQFLMGISWERALLFHKAFAMSSLITGAVHGIPFLIPATASEIYHTPILFSGVLLQGLMCLQPLLYILVKYYWFEGFYISHIIINIVVTYVAILHHTYFFLYATMLWAVDMIVRYILTSRKVIIHIKNVTSDITMVSIDSKINYRAGQYVFLMIPSLGVLQWHPFSISSSPHDDKVTSDVCN